MKDIGRLLSIIFLVFLVFQVKGQSSIDSLVYVSEAYIYFETDSFRIKNHHHQRLDSLYQLFASADHFFSIDAHTDDVGSSQYNEQLSQKRANAVASQLVNLGVSDSMLSVSAFGESRPIAPNSSSEGRSQNRRVSIKIYRHVLLQWISGRLVDSVTHVGIAGRIRLHSKLINSQTVSDSSGHFRIMGPQGEVAGIDVNAGGYLLYTHMFKVKPILATKPMSLKIPPISPGRMMRLEKLYFEGNKDVLLDKSHELIDDIKIFAKQNPDICLEVQGHINLPHHKPVNNTSWNYFLSIARAKKIYQALVPILSSEQLVYKGYGNWHMIYPQATTEAEMSKNRRVELKILSCDRLATMHSDTLPPDIDFSTGKRSLLSKTFE